MADTATEPNQPTPPAPAPAPAPPAGTITARHPPIDFNRAVILRAQGASFKDIARIIGGTPGSIRVGLQRKGRAQIVAQSRAILLQTATTAANLLSKRSTNSRRNLAAVVEQASSVLVNEPITSADQLANTPERQGRAAVLKTLTDAASTVFGWSEQAPAAFVDARGLANCEALDVEQVTTPANDQATQDTARLLADLPGPDAGA